MSVAVPCAFCLRGVAAGCRKNGCLREQYYAGAMADLPAGFDWYPAIVVKKPSPDAHLGAIDA